MDPRWWPWCWALAAVFCAVAFTLAQPWTREFRAGLSLTRQWPAAWLIPGALLLADTLAAAWRQKAWPDWTFVPVGQSTGAALAETIHGFSYGDGAALIAGTALALNVGGMRKGLRAGLDDLSPKSGSGVPMVLFMALAAGLLNLILCRALPGLGWRVAFSVLEAPLAGWTCTMVLAALLLLAETTFRNAAPAAEKTPRRGRKSPKPPSGAWLETAAAHSIRLWPWALAQAVLWPLCRWIPQSWVPWAGWVPLVPGLVMIFAPLVFLHVKRRSDAPEAWRSACRFWLSRGWQGAVWLAVAGLWFFLFHYASAWLLTSLAGQSRWLRITLASFQGLAHTWLTVAMLGAWVALRLRDLPPPSRTSARRAPIAK